ncbi:MAG: hypothetical protein A3C13_00920 [Candidatus Lloydbacteria bacterium RIFCSPHIGHO2_02_FULL_50_11]|nr:MAG: hypothetical protein A3C13_00920 [Candidatus Lloydbacteria bacterium RIFCSPHIGHO2_02_FULL_50_11]
MLTWYIDKEVLQSGVGKKSVEVMTKDFGQTVTINVVIATSLGTRYDKQFLLRPVEVDLLWEADTVTPPFYKGKALPTYKSIVKATAISRFNSFTSDPSSSFHKWTTNYTQGLGEGLGKSSAIIPMKYSGSSVSVSVKVDNTGAEGGSGTATKNIVGVDPLLLFYEDAPLAGIRFDRALFGNIEVGGTAFTVRAAPYFFSNDDLVNANVIYSWFKDNVKIATGLDSNKLILGKEGSSAQSSALLLSLKNRNRVLQSASARLTVSFSQE